MLCKSGLELDSLRLVVKVAPPVDNMGICMSDGKFERFSLESILVL